MKAKILPVVCAATDDTPYQVALYPASADSLPSPFPPAAIQGLFPVDSGDTVTTANVGGGSITIVPRAASYTYNEPASDEAGISKDVQDSIVALGTDLKILALEGNNQNNLGADLFVQLWSYPVVTDGKVTTGTLVNDDANADATLVFSARILNNYNFSIKIERGTIINNCILAFSQRDRDHAKPFYMSDLTAAITCNVLIESTAVLP